MAPTTFAQKVLAQASGEPAVEPGQIVNARIDLAMSHENAALVLRSFREIGASQVWDRDKMVILFDHRIPANTTKAAENHKTVREFVRAEGLPHFYDMREGICHQVLPEKGHVRPGMLIVGSDSHTTSYGALGAFSTGIGATEMASVWATGELWLKVPRTIRIHFEGDLLPGVMSKDVILNVIGQLGADGADYRCVEYIGPTVDAMSVASRLVLCNMAVEMGAKAGVCFPDHKVQRYLAGRTTKAYVPVVSDADAPVERTLELDVSKLGPQVACPHQVDNVRPVEEVEGLPIDQALIGSCTNGRMEDLIAAASLLSGQTVADGVRLIIVPASREVYLEAMERGILASFVRAGALVLNPGCGPCLGAHQGLLAPGERAITTTNRNFRGRMGSPEAEIYLASPLTVAASAIKGVVTDPRRLML